MMTKMKNKSCSDGFVFNCNDGNFVYLEIHFDFRFSNIVVKNIKLLNESCKCVHLCVFFCTNSKLKCCCVRFASMIITLFVYLPIYLCDVENSKSTS
jgi:hypothetical protein